MFSLFYSKNQDDAEKAVENIFKQLVANENDIIRPKTLTILGRDVVFQKVCGQILNSTFAELCDRVSSIFLDLCFSCLIS